MRNPYTGRVIAGSRGRRGWGGWPAIFGLLLVAAALLLGASALFYPWIYFAGGHWHALPEWRGWGHFKADGGDYALFIRMIPAPSGKGLHLSTGLKGDAYLCTPQGQRLHLALYGAMQKHLPLDVRGQPIYLGLRRRAVWAPWQDGSFREAGDPSLKLKGTWGERSITAAGFLLRARDGAQGTAEKSPGAPVTVSFEEATGWVLWPECPDPGRH
jgi:hypothetical protein